MPPGSSLRAFVRDRGALNAVAAPLHRGAMLALTEARALVPRVAPGTLPADAGFPRVVIDGCAFHATSGGIPRLWDAILDRWSESGFGQHVVVLDRGGTAPRHPGISYRPHPLLRAHDSSAERRMLQRACDAERADVFVSTLYTRPALTPTLLYLHDMTPEVLGKDPRQPLYRDKRAAIASARSIVCLTHATRSDLGRFEPTAAERVAAVVHPGVDASFAPRPAEEIAALTRRLALPERYVLYLGHRTNFKGAPLLFDALRMLLDQGRMRDVGLLALGGDPGLEARYADVAARMPVRVTRLAEPELRAAYSGAAAFVFPSRNEGFGLPMIEALACGCPVIAADVPALREAGGGQARYVDADDAVGLATAIEETLAHPPRTGVRDAGMRHARGFSWEDAASLLAQVITTTAADA